MESSFRRLMPLVLVVGLLLAAAPPVAATDPSLAAAETTMVGLLNAQRTAAGLVPLQVDARLTTIARARSTDMAVNNYFGHQQPDGRWAWDLMNQAGIVWYGAGEIIGRTSGLALSGSVTAVAQSWQASAPHSAIITSNTFNYFGVGVAIDATGRIIWTGVFMQGPDRTAPSAMFKTASNVTSATTSSTNTTVKHLVTLKWTGSDIPLQTLTAGVADYRVQYRLAGTTTWSYFATPTTATTKSVSLLAGRIYEFRVEAKDKAANFGPWGTLKFRP